MSYYLVAFQGSNAVGGLAFGTVAQASSVSDAFLAISVCLLVGSLLTWRLALPRAISAEVEAAEPWALPEVRDPEAGPVMVSVTWPVQPERLDDFLALAGELRRLRRRTGAGSWRLYRQAEDQYELLETFIVGSWAEHERQHARMYPSDTGVLDRLDQTLLPDRPRLSFITPSPSGPDNGSSQITMDRDHSPSTRSAQRRRGLRSRSSPSGASTKRRA